MPQLWDIKEDMISIKIYQLLQISISKVTSDYISNANYEELYISDVYGGHFSNKGNEAVKYLQDILIKPIGQLFYN